MCLIELQDAERQIHSKMADGQVIAADYIEELLKLCVAECGKIFVLEVGGHVAGYTAVQAKAKMTWIEEVPYEYAYISDLVVLKAYRQRGFGQALLQVAEAYARQQGATLLRLSVLAKNEAARRLYEKFGFVEHEIELEKKLSETE